MTEPNCVKQVMLGGTPGMGLAWDPVVELENPKRETIVPYHQLVDATLEGRSRVLFTRRHKKHECGKVRDQFVTI